MGDAMGKGGYSKAAAGAKQGKIVRSCIFFVLSLISFVCMRSSSARESRLTIIIIISISIRMDMEMEEGSIEWGDLPLDVAHHILLRLSVIDICSLGSCCQYWRSICSSDLTWSSLYKKRWPIQNKFLTKDNAWKALAPASCPANMTIDKSWKALYTKAHKELAIEVSSIIKYMMSRTCHESIEVADYQKVMEVLCTLDIGFQDVQFFLLVPNLSVLMNLLGLHYCFSHLGVQNEDVRAALVNSQASERQVCLRWWSLGRWANGFRRHDEMHVQNASLYELTTAEKKYFLQVIERGTLHEVLRVQISADFKSSAWVARDMHSQR